ncbi:MAG: hypothetical protein VX278_18650 [Myxococcota bacterium]|nr:hypothetical protein [Myxococcota bacterium]
MRKGQSIVLKPFGGQSRYTITLEVSRETVIDLFVFALNEQNKAFNICEFFLGRFYEESENPQLPSSLPNGGIELVDKRNLSVDLALCGDEGIWGIPIILYTEVDYRAMGKVTLSIFQGEKRIVEYTSIVKKLVGGGGVELGRLQYQPDKKNWVFQCKETYYRGVEVDMLVPFGVVKEGEGVVDNPNSLPGPKIPLPSPSSPPVVRSERLHVNREMVVRFVSLSKTTEQPDVSCFLLDSQRKMVDHNSVICFATQELDLKGQYGVHFTSQGKETTFRFDLERLPSTVESALFVVNWRTESLDSYHIRLQQEVLGDLNSNILFRYQYDGQNFPKGKILHMCQISLRRPLSVYPIHRTSNDKLETLYQILKHTPYPKSVVESLPPQNIINTARPEKSDILISEEEIVASSPNTEEISLENEEFEPFELREPLSEASPEPVADVRLEESDLSSDFQIFAELEDMNALQFNVGFPLRTVQAEFDGKDWILKAVRKMKSTEKQYRLPEDEGIIPRKVKLILQRQR